MNTFEVLTEARKLIEEPGAWTQHEYSRAASYEYVSPRNTQAICFCMLGAISKASGIDEHSAIDTAASDLLSRILGELPHVFNDAPDRTHAEVLAAFDKAIAAAQVQS